MRHRLEPLLAFLLCAGIIAGYFWISSPASPQYGLLKPEQQHFNQLVAGFRSGHLWLKQVPAPELAKLADPYDPDQNANYRLHDASYYKGRFYIYYGVTPVVVLFWPYFEVTGHYLAQKYAVFLFCSVGFLAGAYLVWQLRRRCFQHIGSWIFLSTVLAVGTVNGAAFLLRRPEMYEVSISCAYAMMMAALAAMWGSLTSERHPLAWTAASSVFFGLAVGARPTFLFGAASLAIPFAYLLAVPNPLSPRQGLWKLTLAAFAPIGTIGAGLAAYNYLRFGNPFEFGIKYLMMGKEVARFFGVNWHYVWLNARFYFLLPTKLTGYFPFVRGVEFPPFPMGYAFAENPYGVLPNIPYLALALAAPLALLHSQREAALRLKLLVCALSWIFVTSVAVLLVYVVATIRYELDFTPYLAVLAVLGVFGIEGCCATRQKWLIPARLAWAALLAVSFAFNFFGSCQHLGVLSRDAPGEFNALSKLFDLPIYCYHRYLASETPAPPLIQSPGGDVMARSYGAVLETLELSTRDTGAREPLLVVRGSAQSTSIAFIRSAGKSRITVGFDFPGVGSLESQPIEIVRNSPIEIAILAPQLFPDLGYPDWKGTAYGRQLFVLGSYTILVNHRGALQVTSPLSGPIRRGLPLVIGANPLEGTSVSARFTGRITGISRLGIGERNPPLP